MHCVLDERCGDGIDDDCDGEVDEDACNNGSGGSAGAGGGWGTGGSSGEAGSSASSGKSSAAPTSGDDGGCALRAPGDQRTGWLIMAGLALAAALRRRSPRATLSAV